MQEVGLPDIDIVLSAHRRLSEMLHGQRVLDILLQTRLHVGRLPLR